MNNPCLCVHQAMPVGGRGKLLVRNSFCPKSVLHGGMWLCAVLILVFVVCACNIGSTSYTPYKGSVSEEEMVGVWALTKNAEDVVVLAPGGRAYTVFRDQNGKLKGLGESWRLDKTPSPITGFGKKGGPVYMKVLTKQDAKSQEGELLIVEHFDGQPRLAVYDIDVSLVYQKTVPSKLPFNVFEFLMREMPEFKEWFSTQQVLPTK